MKTKELLILEVQKTPEKFETKGDSAKWTLMNYDQ